MDNYTVGHWDSERALHAFEEDGRSVFHPIVSIIFYYTPFRGDSNPYLQNFDSRNFWGGILTKRMNYDMLTKTVEVEITLIMLPQRARVAENRAEHKSSNGPLRAQSKAFAEYSVT